jgi:hypothetical protein
MHGEINTGRAEEKEKEEKVKELLEGDKGKYYEKNELQNENNYIMCFSNLFILVAKEDEERKGNKKK